MLSRNQVNKAIAKLGDVTLIKGNNYFYFIGKDVSVDADGVYVNNINQLTIEDWIIEAKSILNKG